MASQGFAGKTVDNLSHNSLYFSCDWPVHQGDGAMDRWRQVKSSIISRLHDLSVCMILSHQLNHVALTSIFTQGTLRRPECLRVLSPLDASSVPCPRDSHSRHNRPPNPISAHPVLTNAKENQPRLNHVLSSFRRFEHHRHHSPSDEYPDPSTRSSSRLYHFRNVYRHQVLGILQA